MNCYRATIFGEGNSKQEAQLSLGQPAILVVTDLEDHPRSMILISSEK